MSSNFTERRKPRCSAKKKYSDQNFNYSSKRKTDHNEIKSIKNELKNTNTYLENLRNRTSLNGHNK